MTRLGEFWIVLVTYFSFKSSLNWWLLFGLKWKDQSIEKKLLWLFLGNFWNNLGYFSFQHLVTLVRRPITWGKKVLRNRPWIDFNFSFKCCSWSVWPDLAKFCHLSKALNVFEQFLKALNSIWQIFQPTLANFYAIGPICIAWNGQIFKNNIPIWSHCWWCCANGTCKLT